MGSQRPTSAKMGIRAGTRAYLDNAPDLAVRAMELPALDISNRLIGKFDYMHLFATTQDGMRSRFGPMKAHLADAGALWVSWPKGGKLDTDLKLPVVIAIGYDLGLVESTTLSVDATWSAIRFTWPKPGKTYANSYGTLRRD